MTVSTAPCVELPQPGGWLARPSSCADATGVGRPPAAATSRGSPSRGARRRRPLRRERAGRPGRRRLGRDAGFRRHLFRYGFGVAEAMDTAQRNMGLDWPAVQELIRAQRRAGRWTAAPGSPPGPAPTTPDRADSLDEVADAYAEQVAFVEDAGSQVIVMASRQLAARPRSAPTTTARSTATLLGQVREPVDPALAGRGVRPAAARLLGLPDVDAATETFLELVREHAGKVDGVKVSLLSRRARDRAARRAARGRAALHRRRLPLPRADPRRRRRTTPTRCSARSRRSPPPRRRRWPRSTPGTCDGTTRRWRRPLPLSRHIFDRADLPLQDRDRVPGLALGPPARVHDGRRAAVGAIVAAPGRAVRAGRRRRGCCRTPSSPPADAAGDGGCSRGDRDPASTRRRRSPADARRPAAGAAVAQPADHARWSLREAIDGCRRGRAAARSGCGASRSPRSGWRRPPLAARRRAAGLVAVPRRVLHRRRPGRAAGRARRQPARHRRGRGAGRAAAWCWCRAACRRATATWPGPARGRATRSPTLAPHARARGVALGIEPMHPIFAADRGVVSTLGQALDIAEQFPADEVGVVVDTFHLWWEPGHRGADRPRRRADRSATRCATGSPRCRRTPCSRAG